MSGGWASGRCARRSTPPPRAVGWCSICSGRWPSSSVRSSGTGQWPDWQRRGRAAGSEGGGPSSVPTSGGPRASSTTSASSPSPRSGKVLGVSRTSIYRALDKDAARSGGRGDRAVNAGERLVTVLVTVAVPAAADPEDAAALVADAAVSTALDVVHAVAVEGHSGCGPPGGSRRCTCLLYTSDAADDLLCVDLGGRRIIKKK